MPNLNNEQTRKNILDNIAFIVKSNNIVSQAELAKTIGVATSTWQSFIKNPLANSTAKALFCEKFGISLRELENEVLNEDYFMSKFNSDSQRYSKLYEDDPISKISNEAFFNKIINSKKAKPQNSEIDKLKMEIINNGALKLKVAIEQTVEEAEKDPVKALNIISGTLLNLSSNDTYLLSEDHLRLFVDLCVKCGSETSIWNLFDKLVMPENYDYKILTLFGILLEESYPDAALECYRKVVKDL